MRRIFTWIVPGVGAFVLALVLGCGGGGGVAASINHAAAFAWREYADTDLDMSEFYDKNFTIVARVMIQYPRAYVGPILAASDNGFELSKQDDAGHLIARFGNGTYSYSLGTLQAAKWHHLAVLRLSGLVFVYVDGQPICPDDFSGCAVDAGFANGVLRFGRPGLDALAGVHESQHFGFIDDVGVFDVALSQGTIEDLAAAPRLTGGEAGLLAGYTFDGQTPDGKPLPPELARPVTYWRLTPTGPVASPYPFGALIGKTRDSAFDAKFLPFPNNQVPLRLPFPSGEAWVVGQGWQGSVSHHGVAAFAWDFSLAGQPPEATEGKRYYAAAPGPVIDLLDNRTSCSGWPANHVDVEHAPEEVGVYLHHVQGTAAVSMGQNVGTGTYLADTGDTGNTGCGSFHVHFALHNFPESQAGVVVTIPATFENYEVSTNGGVSWSPVVKGIPKQGEWVRNP